ncbi:hypothetical protein R50073_04430 [Maricurvus nonylphenolicus]|uniref:hypothetical protein n=1 Tax=Maricurvus nonylphenolicus TaxID=1008307 RepID=UPI0036F24A29
MAGFSAEDAASAILKFAEALPGPYGYEASIKFIGAELFQHRFLITFPKIAMQHGADLHGLLRSLSFPQSSFSELERLLDEGDMLHLGFEQEAQHFLCKLYVEDARKIREIWAADAASLPKQVRVHRALKWRSDSEQCIATEYDWLPCCSTDQLISCIQSLCEGVSASVLRQLLDVAAVEAPLEDLQLLRVSEPNSPRQSFDLNLYDAQLRVASVETLLPQLFESGVPGLLSMEALNPIRDRLMGHIAAGVSRSGERFLTVYYGAEQRGSFAL